MITSHSKFNLPKVGAIFCGGKSTRMGVPKAGILLENGMTLAEHVYYALKQVCERIVFVGHGVGVSQRILKNEIHLKDEIPGLGPLGAFDALLSSGIAEEYIVSPCDLCLVVPGLFKLLEKSYLKGPVVLKSEGRVEPLIGRYPASILPQLRNQLKVKDFSIQSFLKKCNAQYVDVPYYLRNALSNANTPQDLILK